MLGSIQVFTTTMAIMPMPPRAQQLALHVWLQNFVWNEVGGERRLIGQPGMERWARASLHAVANAARHPEPPPPLPAIAQEEQEAALAERPPIYAKEPLFCFETAVKALYYSMLVYYYKGSDELGPVGWESECDCRARCVHSRKSWITVLQGKAAQHPLHPATAPVRTCPPTPVPHSPRPQDTPSTNT